MNGSAIPPDPGAVGDGAPDPTRLSAADRHTQTSSGTGSVAESEPDVFDKVWSVFVDCCAAVICYAIVGFAALAIGGLGHIFQKLGMGNFGQAVLEYTEDGLLLLDTVSLLAYFVQRAIRAFKEFK